MLHALTGHGAVDGEFCARLLASGLTSARGVALRAFLVAFLFKPGTIAFTDAAVRELTTTMVDFPVTLLLALRKAVFVDAAIEADSDVARGLLELVYYFEEDVRNPAWSNVNTLSRWLQTAEEQAAQRSDTLTELHRATGFLSFLRRVYEENRHKWDAAHAAAPEAKAGLAPASSVPMANAFERAKESLGTLLLGFIKVGLRTSGATVVPEAMAKLDGWETTVLAPGGALRARVVDAVVRVPKYAKIYAGDGGGFLKLMRDGALLDHASHFSGGLLSAMCLPAELATGTDVQLVFRLVSVGIKLRQWEGLDASVRDVWRRSCTADDRKQQLQRIATRVDKRPVADFFPANAKAAAVSFTALDDCARYATEAIRLLSTAPDTQKKINGLFDYYLKSSPPASWVGLFKSAETIAFFLKYLDREDLPKAYAAFKAANTDNTTFELLISRVQAVYTQPVVTGDDMQLTDPDSINKLIARVEAAGKADDTVLGVLQHIAAEWMKKSYAKLLTPMAPRNAQMIMFLLCAEWAQARFCGALPQAQRTLVGRVGTGEGKSLIIAMISIYLAKVLGKKVHVLEANMGLMDRDHADFDEFYTRFGLTSACNDFSSGADITYCLTGTLNHFYRDRVGKQPFGNTVLLVDEVDALIVDGDANTSYVKPDADASNLTAIFDALASGGGEAAQFSRDPLHGAARAAYQRAQELLRAGLNRPDGYVVVGNEYKCVNSKGVMLENRYDLGLEYLSYTKLGKKPESQSSFFYQSTAHMLKQYDAIIGLSGSLGSPAEKAFLMSTYGAKTIDAPPFLDTCRGVSKVPPALANDTVQVYSGAGAHHAAVVALALKQRAHVPVVVLCKNPQAAHALMQQFPAAERAHGAVQLFLERGDDFERMNYSAIVEKATLPVGAGAARVWPVTVADVFGGRGQDYRVADRGVDDAGGLLVVAACFPDTEREWTQWKGRTARNDRAGQYAVLLERADEPVKEDAALLEKHAVVGVNHRSSLIADLLERRDVACKEKIANQKAALVQGMRMNELCDKFWTKEGGMGGAWPSGEAQTKLRKFLTGYERSLDDIAAFAADVRLAASAAAYKAASAYGA